MEVSAGLDAPHPPAVLFAWVADLGRYPSWLDIVTRAEPAPPAPADEGRPAWTVDLRARLGPIARSKRLRMVRTVAEPDRLVRFERAELDGREHASWVLSAAIEPIEAGCRLTMTLHYAGGGLAPLVQRLLGDEIERSRRRLLEQLAADAPS